MIAIAGAKGGCGKTVTTLGLAEAFARAGTPALAVDADRQLPNLHVIADIDRKPTLTAIEDGANVQATAQRSPRNADVGVVPAPTPSDHIDFERVIDRLDFDSVQTLVDCPSGAGPDVVEPLDAADGVIIITTGSDRSLTAAERTIDMADRLGVPVLGIVGNKCEAVPDDIESWLDNQVLGVVPEQESPLSSAEIQDCYDDIVTTLQMQHTSSRPAEFDADLMKTGIEQLDQTLCGGVPPGSVTVLSADPASQSEQLLYRTTGVRGTLYLTTGRSETNVQRAVETASVETGTPTIRAIDGEEPLDQAMALIEKLPTGATLVIDAMDVFERHERTVYRSFLNKLTAQMVETGSIAFMHCLNGERVPENRSVTKHAADAVFDLRTVVPGARGAVDHQLSILKYRANSTAAETIELDFSEPEPVPVEPAPDTA